MSEEIEFGDAAAVVQGRPQMFLALPLYGGALLRMVLAVVRCGYAAGLVTAATVTVDDASLSVRWEGDGRLADLDSRCDEPWLAIVTRHLLIGRSSDELGRLIEGANDLVLVRAFSDEFHASATNDERTVTVVSDQHGWSCRTTGAGGRPHVSVTFLPDAQRVGPVASSTWPKNECERLQAAAPALRLAGIDH